MNLNKRIERDTTEKDRVRQNLAPDFKGGRETWRTKFSLRTLTAAACMLVLIISLSVALPIVLTNSSSDSDQLRFSFTEQDFNACELGYYINPLYVGEEEADASNFGICLEEYCLKNDLDILCIPRNIISPFYADEHIAWRNTYMHVHKEDPSIRYWQEQLLSPDTPSDPKRSGQISMVLTVMTKNNLVKGYEVDEKDASATIIDGIKITYGFGGDYISSSEFAYSYAEVDFAYGDYKYHLYIEPKQPLLIISDGAPLTPPDISAIQIYIEDILSALN